MKLVLGPRIRVCVSRMKAQAIPPTPTETLSAWMRDAFAAAYPGASLDGAGLSVVAATNPAFGDLQCNDAMSLAGRLKAAPRDIAAALLKHAPAHPAVADAQIAGPGFINIRLRDAWLLEYVAQMGSSDRLGVPEPGRGKTAIFDYSSPNVAKPMHIGHIRSTIIGHALDRMYRFLGYRVVADNHLGDWGTQFGVLIVGYRRFCDAAELERDPIGELARVYVRSYARAREDPAWMEECRRELVKLQQGDPENVSLWRRFVELSMQEFNRIYRRLNIAFDLVRGESHYHEQLEGMVAELRQRGLARESEGATVVFLEEEGLPLCIVRKSDGGFNYAATDIATALSRVAEFDPERIVYVTDERQQLHFRQFFAVCRRLGCATRLDHVWFGLMRLPEGVMAAREGKAIRLESLLDEAERRALEIVRRSSPDMPSDEQARVARAVGIGAVKYADLSQNPQTAVVFTWDKALALDGNSGPYLQYAHARIASVRDKFAERFPDVRLEACGLRLDEAVERALVLKLAGFPEAVLRAAAVYKPSVVADYLFDLAQTYSRFYQNVPFLKADAGLRESRVRLCVLTARVLRRGLNLLGIETPDRI